MLPIISGYAMWHGMRDFIVGVSSTTTTPEIGGISVSNDVLVIAVVVALTFLMWLTLCETFGAKCRLRARLITFPLYVFLAIWSIGFGYGFWWRLISGEEQRAPASRDCKKMPATPAPSSRRGWKPCAASSTTSSRQPDDAGRNEQRAVAAPLPAQARAHFTTHGVAFAIPSARCAIA